MALEYKIPFFETSAISNVNVVEAFTKIASDVRHRLDADGAVTGKSAAKAASSSSSSTASSSATIPGSNLEAPPPVKKRGWC